MYKIIYSKQAIKDLDNLKKSGLSLKVKKLIDIIKEDPYCNPPRYERLVGNLNGYYSRRINIQHRLVYEIIKEDIIINNVHYEGYIKILRMWTHYE